jgi:hypothetical protein
MQRRLVFLVLLSIACGAAPEIRLGAKNGIPAVTGSTEVTLDAFVCGNPIAAGDTTITTQKVSGGCQLSFDKDVEIVKASDYSNIPELKGATNLLQAVEMTITRLDFTDTTTNTALDLSTQVTTVTLSINGQQVADKAALSALPKTVSLTGAALDAVKAKVNQRLPATVTATCVAVLPDSPPPPKKMKIDYDAQPTLVLGTGSIKLPM